VRIILTDRGITDFPFIISGSCGEPKSRSRGAADFFARRDRVNIEDSYMTVTFRDFLIIPTICLAR